MSYLCYLCLFGSFLPPVVCRRDHVLFTLFVFACEYWCLTHMLLCFCFVFDSFVELSIFDCPLRYSLTPFKLQNQTGWKLNYKIKQDRR